MSPAAGRGAGAGGPRRDVPAEEPPGPGADLPLRGVRVLELGNYIAGPTGGRLLADFGAEVIKIERPGTGDEVRNWRLYAGTTSMLFRTLNRGKKSVVLDLRTSSGRDVALGLARHSDVVLENFRPGTLEKWGLGPAELEAVNPDLVLVRVSAFGQTGPASQRPGFGAVAESVGGLRHLVGEPDRPPSRIGVSIGDSIAGLYAAFGAVMGLLERDRARSDRQALSRRVIDVALNEAVLSMTESLIPDFLAYDVQRVRAGGRMEGIAPSNAYPCADGRSVIIAGNGDQIFRRLATAAGHPEWLEDPGLASNAGRWRERDQLDAEIGAWTSMLSRDEVLRRLDVAEVPSGPVYTAKDVVADEQYRARDMIQYFSVDVGSGTREVGFPGVVPVIGPRSLPVRTLGPDLGEHTREVLADVLGMTDEEIGSLEAAMAGER